MPNRHVPSLDGVRGVAILMVLLIHLELFRAVPGTSTTMLHVRDLFWAGWRGVDLFFVLSGFLITGILLDAIGTRRYFYTFYMRRVLRIFPLYYFALIVAFAATLMIVPRLRISIPRDSLPTWWGWFSYLFYFQNWRLPDALLGHFWSLGVEEQFYLMWPICVYCLSRRQLLRLCAVAFGVCFGVRFLLVQQNPYGSALLMTNTFARMDTLLVGAFCALAVRDPRLLNRVRPMLPYIAIISSCGMVAIDFVAHEIRSRAYYTQSFGYSLLALGFGTLVLWAYLHAGTGTILDKSLQQVWLRKLGKYSYGIYVYHHPVFLVGSAVFTGVKVAGHDVIPSIPYCVGIVAASVLVARASYAILERPFLEMKRRFEPRERIPLEVIVAHDGR
jgi:peptidoglycan/LPS O-acetylase OafA/YrhL